MERKPSIKRIVAVMLVFVLAIGVTACGNSSGQPESRQDTIGQIEDHSVADSTVDSVSEPVAEELETGTEEVSEDMTAGAETADTEETGSNILIAYFSRVGNINFDESIDAVTSASVNMDGSNVSGNAQLLAEMAQKVTGGDLFFIETVEKYPADYRGTTDQAKKEQNDDARLLDGLSVKGSEAGSAQAEVEEWINSSGIME